MIARCLALATVGLVPAMCQAGSDNYNRAVATFDAVVKCYGDERLPLFRETYPFDDQLKVTYLPNEEQADQQKRFSYLWPFSGSLSAVAAIWDARLGPRLRPLLRRQHLDRSRLYRPLSTHSRPPIPGAGKTIREKLREKTEKHT